jgi:O-antigen ligase
LWFLLSGLLLFAVVYSASRKGFLGLLLFIGLWLWFSYRQRLFSKLRYLLFMALALLAAYALMDSVWDSTRLGQRLQYTVYEEELSLGLKRTTYYQEAFVLFLTNPVAGVGLGNFQIFSVFGSYSHSEYAEALSTTGLVGGFLYFAIYAVFWFRLRRIQSLANRDERVNSDLGVFKAFVITLLTLAISRINYQSILTMFALAGIIGYAYALEQSLSRSRQTVRDRLRQRRQPALFFPK